MIPRLSIITINLNNKSGLEKTILSVRKLISDDIEYIVVDGNSNDGSINIINRYSDSISEVVIENDTGIYNAMNKGIRRSRGEYLLFLNSGDYLIENLQPNTFLNSLNAPLVIFETYRDQQSKRNIFGPIPNNLDVLFFYNNSIPHCSTFIKRKLFEQIGYYNENYVIISDWIFFFQCIVIGKIDYRVVNYPISVFESNGVSSKKENYLLIKDEKKKYLTTIFPELPLLIEENLRFKGLPIYKIIFSKIFND